MLVADNTAGDVRAVAKVCGIDEARVSDFYNLFARTEQTITCELSAAERLVASHSCGLPQRAVISRPVSRFRHSSRLPWALQRALPTSQGSAQRPSALSHVPG